MPVTNQRSSEYECEIADVWKRRWSRQKRALRDLEGWGSIPIVGWDSQQVGSQIRYISEPRAPVSHSAGGLFSAAILVRAVLKLYREDRERVFDGPAFRTCGHAVLST